jgi:hypothetical protein
MRSEGGRREIKGGRRQGEVGGFLAILGTL